MAATMADALRIDQQEYAARVRECDWHRIVREHDAPSVVDQGIRAREAFDRAQRQRSGLGVPSDLSAHDLRVQYEHRPSAFGSVRENAAGRERERFERERRPFFERPFVTTTDDHSRTYVFTSTPSEDSTSAGAFRSWSQWQRDYADRIFGHPTAAWFEDMYTAATEPPEDPEQPAQHVFEGELPVHYIDAGATGKPFEITRDELLQERDVVDVLNDFVQAARIHAPWLEVVQISGSFHDPEILIRYQRPCLTDLPA